MTHGSFFTGVGSFDLGFERAGFRTLFASEVKPFSCAVYATHYPDVPNLGDLNAICPDGIGSAHECVMPRATVWTGGFPCSDLSTMGVRRGLHAGQRSSLALVFLDLVDRHRPEWLVLENVPGLLTASEGRDLAALLGTLGELGYGWSYRLLDARDFGLPQARRRLFIVAGPTASGAGAVLDDATYRLLDAPSGHADRRPALARGRAGADPDSAPVALAPTHGQFGSSALARRDEAFPVTPSNPQYVISKQWGFGGGHSGYGQLVRANESFSVLPGAAQFIVEREPVVISQYGAKQVVLRRPGAGTATIVATQHFQYVIEPIVAVEPYGPGRGPSQNRDVSPPIRPPRGWGGTAYVIEPEPDGGPVLGVDELRRSGRLERRRRWRAARRHALGDAERGRDPGVGLGGPGAGPGRAEDHRPQDSPAGVRAPAGSARRLDRPERGGDEGLGPVDLDNARWHVLGRALPVPIAHWLAAGLATVVRELDRDPDAYADPTD